VPVTQEAEAGEFLSPGGKKQKNKNKNKKTTLISIQKCPRM
jgi:hypothetical protein